MPFVRIRAFVVIGALAGSLTACTDARPGPAGIEPLQSPQQLQRLNIRLDLPPAGSTTTISADEAIGLCDGDATCPRDRSHATISLASATTDMNSTIGESGRSTPTIADRLVVALLFPDSECVADSGPAGRPTDPSPPSTDSCLWVTLIDASTHGWLLSASA